MGDLPGPVTRTVRYVVDLEYPSVDVVMRITPTDRKLERVFMMYFGN
jgi:hypothetical protein